MSFICQSSQHIFISVYDSDEQKHLFIRYLEEKTVVVKFSTSDSVPRWDTLKQVPKFRELQVPKFPVPGTSSSEIK